jgi:hypothetical protein
MQTIEHGVEKVPHTRGAAESDGFGRLALTALAALPAMLLSAGCATTSGAPYAPETSFTARSDLDALKAQFASATSIQDYYSQPETKERRNRFIAGRLVLYDLAYVDWVSRFRFGRAAESTILDTATLGVSQAITLFGGARTKEVLGAIGAAIAGTRSSYEKNFFDEAAGPAIAAQMNAERKAALVPVMAGTRAGIDEYPLAAALADLASYQQAGTLDGALSGIQREAGLKEAKALARLERYRSAAYAADEASDRLLQWVYPGMDSVDPDGVVRDAAGNPVRKNGERVAAVEAELEKLELDGLAIGTLLSSADLASVRAKIVRNLQIQ